MEGYKFKFNKGMHEQGSDRDESAFDTSHRLLLKQQFFAQAYK
jgi:hypothetical protein